MSKEEKVFYRIETVRDPKMVKAFVLFTYRQAHPKVTRNFIIIGILSLALTYGIRIPDLRLVLWILGGFCLLMGIFRHWIPITMLKGSDEDYVNKNLLTYVFSESGIKAYRNGEEYLSVDGYRRVHNLYHDEWYYFLGADDDLMMILPKDRFIEGDPDTFGDFIRQKAGIESKWSPATRAEKRKKNKADGALRAAKATAFQKSQAEERERQRQMIKKAWAERKKSRQ